ncbi:hypothetical protein ACIQZI_17315 [Peribacillus sp. NPDC096379]|uniref:hypothetical protein n=1 Tax=Peribacillus sp. NPDC096379 TaxID=3364393 RepID=UPI0037FF1E44
MSTEFLSYTNKINRLPLVAYLLLWINEYDTLLDYVHTWGFASVDSRDDIHRDCNDVLDANYAEGANVVAHACDDKGSTVDDAQVDGDSSNSYHTVREIVHIEFEGIPSLHLLFLRIPYMICADVEIEYVYLAIVLGTSSALMKMTTSNRS